MFSDHKCLYCTDISLFWHFIYILHDIVRWDTSLDSDCAVVQNEYLGNCHNCFKNRVLNSVNNLLCLRFYEASHLHFSCHILSIFKIVILLCYTLGKLFNLILGSNILNESVHENLKFTEKLKSFIGTNFWGCAFCFCFVCLIFVCLNISLSFFCHLARPKW